LKGRGTGFVLLAILTTFMLVAVPMGHPDPRSFLEGATSLRQTLNELTTFSLGTSRDFVLTGVRVAVALAAIAGAVEAVRAWRDRSGALVVLSGGTLAISLLILLAAHRRLHAPFPQGGAIYLIPLSVLLVTSLFLKWDQRAARAVFFGAGLLLIGVYLSRMSLYAYADGTEYAGGRAVAKALRADAGQRPVRVGVSLAAEPVMNYYRSRYRQENWARMERKPLERGYDYYVLAAGDRNLAAQWHLQVLYQDSGMILAR
jgi:hypothetical protein